VLVWGGRPGTLYPGPADLLLSGLGAHLQVLFVVYPVDEFVVNDPAFAAQKHVQAAVPIAYMNARQIPHPNAQGRMPSGLALVVVRRPVQADELTGPAARRLEANAQKFD
jgi:hypothetical protein